MHLVLKGLRPEWVIVLTMWKLSMWTVCPLQICVAFIPVWRVLQSCRNKFFKKCYSQAANGVVAWRLKALKKRQKEQFSKNMWHCEWRWKAAEVSNFCVSGQREAWLRAGWESTWIHRENRHHPEIRAGRDPSACCWVLDWWGWRWGNAWKSG